MQLLIGMSGHLTITVTLIINIDIGIMINASSLLK